MQTRERRKFQRIQFPCEVELQDKNGHFSGTLIDISLKGVLLGHLPHCKYLVGSYLDLHLQLKQDVCIEMQLRVVFANDSQLGCCWEKIDIDSFCHLKRVIELNAGDSELLLRELGELSPR